MDHKFIEYFSVFACWTCLNFHLHAKIVYRRQKCVMCCKKKVFKATKGGLNAKDLHSQGKQLTSLYMLYRII